MTDLPETPFVPKTSERTLKPVIVIEISPIGFGTAESTISYVKKVEGGDFRPEIIEASVEIIKSGGLIKPVDNHDDGCIDGRPTLEVQLVDPLARLTEGSPLDNSNHERAKVAGGGYITSLAMLIGVTEAGKTVNHDVALVAKMLSERDVFGGMHTGQHIHSEGATDCGANDRFTQILKKSGEEKGGIQQATIALLEQAGVDSDGEEVGVVIDAWTAREKDTDYFDGSTGKSRFQAAIETIAEAQIAKNASKPLAVSKVLGGSHNEGFIVINYREGETFSQVMLQDKLKTAFPDAQDSELPMAFVVDAWRINQLAKILSETDKTVDYKTALAAGIAFQLATAASLTDGTLRTFIVK